MQISQYACVHSQPTDRSKPRVLSDLISYQNHGKYSTADFRKAEKS